MIVAMHDRATEENIQQVIERMVELGFNVHRTTGAAQTILAGVGTPEHFEVAEFKVLAGVYDAYRISSPYKLAGRNFRPEGTTITFPNGVVVGGKGVVVMAGPCSVESREQILTSAKQVAAAGAHVIVLAVAAEDRPLGVVLDSRASVDRDLAGLHCSHGAHRHRRRA